MSERWAEEFELRARALWTDEAVQRVTEGKDLPILPSNAPTLLRAIGLLHRDASRTQRASQTLKPRRLSRAETKARNA